MISGKAVMFKAKTFIGTGMKYHEKTISIWDILQRLRIQIQTGPDLFNENKCHDSMKKQKHIFVLKKPWAFARDWKRYNYSPNILLSSNFKGISLLEMVWFKYCKTKNPRNHTVGIRILVRILWAGRLRIQNNIQRIQTIQSHFDQVDQDQGELRISPEAENWNKSEENRSRRDQNKELSIKDSRYINCEISQSSVS